MTEPVRSIDQPEAQGGALLVDAENLFINHGFWANSYAKEKLIVPGLPKATQARLNEFRELDGVVFEQAAVRTVQHLVTWAVRHSESTLPTRVAFGKDKRSGVSHYDDAGFVRAKGELENQQFELVHVGDQKDAADLALVERFESLLLDGVATFVIGGEDEKYLNAVAHHALGPDSTLKFIFVIPPSHPWYLKVMSDERWDSLDVKAKERQGPKQRTLRTLHEASGALLITRWGRQHFFAALHEIEVPAAADAKRDPASPPLRAGREPNDGPRRVPAASEARRPEPIRHHENVWVLIAQKLTTATFKNAIGGKPAFDQLNQPAWRDRLGQALGKNYAPFRDVITERITNSLGSWPSAAQGLADLNHDDKDAWCLQLAAAVLLPEIGHPNNLVLAESQAAFRAFELAQRQHNTDANL